MAGGEGGVGWEKTMTRVQGNCGPSKQSGEMNPMVTDAGTAARGRSYCSVKEAMSNSPLAKQKTVSAKSKIPSLPRAVNFEADQYPSEATNPEPQGSVGIHHQVVQSC